jgi:phosphoribosylaminoimidazole-succinocarboxamide synthase
MKSTDIARNGRELKRMQKKEEYINEKVNREVPSLGDYITQLHDLFFFTEQKIFQISESEDILMLFVEIKENYTEKQWDTIIRKAVRKTKVAEKETAVKELLELMEMAD